MKTENNIWSPLIKYSWKEKKQLSRIHRRYRDKLELKRKRFEEKWSFNCCLLFKSDVKQINNRKSQKLIW